MGLNAGLIIAVTMLATRVVSERDFENGNTASNLLFLSENARFDFLMLGTSHAEKFSLWHNHERVERMLGKKIMNLSEGGGGGGLVNQFIYFQYFLQKGNKAAALVYFIDPFVFYNDDLDFNPYVYEKEPFYWDFLWLALKNGIPEASLWNYFRSKIKPFWWQLRPETETGKSDFLERADTSILKTRLAVIYSNGMDEKVRERKLETFFQIVGTAEAQNIRVFFVIPPTLLGTLPGTDKLTELLKKLKSEGRADFLDARNALTDPTLYYDHDHLNTAGITAFTEQYLKPFLEGKRE